MPKVPEWDNKPLKTIYNPRPNAKISYKQKNFIITLCERRKIEVPNLDITMQEAAEIITAILGN